MAKKKKPQNKKKQTVSQTQKGDFKLFMKAAWSILLNKSDTENHFTGIMLSLLISLFLNVTAFIIGAVALYGICHGIYDVVYSVTTSFTGVIHGAIELLLAVTMALFALILRGVANEAERETDLNHLLALFSGITGFVAMIIAVVSVVRG